MKKGIIEIEMKIIEIGKSSFDCIDQRQLIEKQQPSTGQVATYPIKTWFARYVDLSSSGSLVGGC